MIDWYSKLIDLYLVFPWGDFFLIVLVVAPPILAVYLLYKMME